jgi:DNA-binding XRE family transcriptional regulator
MVSHHITRGMLTPGLKHWRDHVALTQAELAATAHVARSTVVRGETGDRINVASARRIAVALGVTVAALRMALEGEELQHGQ